MADAPTIMQVGSVAYDDRTRAPALPSPRDLLALGKPNIVLMSTLVAGGSMAIAPGVFPSIERTLMIIVGIALSVAGAGALNMVIERDVDGLMVRTRSRPLPARRVDVWFAAALGIALSAAAVPVLWFGGGPLPVALCLFALFSYVLVYTPLKQKSWWAVVVGAVPGAMPALMGSAAVSGRLDEVGLALFGLLFFWQIPHFLAISVYRENEYSNAGYDVMPRRHGLPKTKVMMLLTALPLLPLQYAFVHLGVASWAYGVVATLLTLWFVGHCAYGLIPRRDGRNDNVWARRVFVNSLIWQVGVFAALGLDVVIRTIW